MKTHSVNETLRFCLGKAFPELAIQTPLNAEKLSLPYILLSSTAEEECITRNSTWRFSLSVEIHTSAYGTPDTEGRRLATLVLQYLAMCTGDLNKVAEDFYVYSVQLESVDEPQVQETDFIQRATFRLIIQF